ncbi:hypothetical protein Vretifemale_4763 [Volvox reticuliferus]|uniref:Large ribosomal subunit protein eL29 n=1 Tax=Volvox reticuliferus TaxID=1737510 RepID=A0A8J4C7R2_9CHLO|nr:hypothetical protein Vretifemale_4763 [Volvox reticuliferus]
MAKSKNHTAHNQNRKAHRNGIKKPQKHKYNSRKGVSCRRCWDNSRLSPTLPCNVAVVHNAGQNMLACISESSLHITTYSTWSFLTRPISVLADGPQVPAQPEVRQEAQQEGGVSGHEETCRGVCCDYRQLWLCGICVTHLPIPSFYSSLLSSCTSYSNGLGHCETDGFRECGVGSHGSYDGHLLIACSGVQHHTRICASYAKSQLLGISAIRTIFTSRRQL